MGSRNTLATAVCYESAPAGTVVSADGSWMVFVKSGDGLWYCDGLAYRPEFLAGVLPVVRVLRWGVGG